MSRAEEQGRGRLTISLEGPDEVRDAWGRLSLASGNVFSTWEWATAWWSECEPRTDARIGVVRLPDGALLGLVPLQRSRLGPIPILRFVGHGVADQLGPICAPIDRAAIAEALPAVLAEMDGGWHAFIGDMLPGDVDWVGPTQGRELLREPSPVIRFNGADWDGYLSTRSSNFRQQVRRKERQLTRAHQVNRRLVEAPDELPRALDALFALHRARWGSHSAFSRSERQQRAFAASALDRGWLRLLILEVDGAPVAAVYALRFGQAISFYQGGRDPAWERASVGFILLAASVRAAFDEGVTEYRLLRGGESYKWRFADEDLGVVTVASARTPVGSAAMAMYLPGVHLKSRLQRLRRMTR